ncbi:LPXTG cell wall anchor domain-containing protein [Marinomonas agarivorans]|nr:LPXTG cell wall anchor domain-containing protein [Marinomonas agarivorans]
MSIPGISSGGGDINPDLSSTAANQGGVNSLGGFSFGDYNTGTSIKGSSSLIIGAVILAVIWYMVKGRKK